VHYPGLVPVYRYHHEQNHNHFYTTDAGEIGTTQHGHTGNHGYKSEGVLGYISPNHIPGSVPVYRYYHGDHHDHFYTTNAAEIGTTQHGQTGNHGFKSEGVLGYAWAGHATGLLVPLYRYFHDQNHDHFYTTNAGEIGTTQHGQTGNHGYKSEGVAFHLFAHALPGLVPLHRYYHGEHHDHFYTADPNEIGTTTPGHSGHHGYKYESIAGYVSTTPFHGSVPIYRYFGGKHDHFYTSNAGEIGTTTPGQTGNHGYKFESIAGYAYP